MMNLKINKYLIYILSAAVLWGTAGIFVRTLSSNGLYEMQIVFARAALTVLTLLIVILFKDKNILKVKLKDLWIFAVTGIFSIILFNFAYFKTMALSTLSVAAVLLYTAPFFVIFISFFCFKEKITSKKLLACITAFLGCCFVSRVFSSANKISGEALFFGLLTGFGYGLYTIFSRVLLKKGYSSLTITFYVFLMSAILCIPLINLPQTVSAMCSSTKVIITALLMAVLNTVLPYIFYTAGLCGINPSVATVIATVETVAATFVGVAVFKENLTVSGIIGIILIFAAAIILNMKSVNIKANAKINLILSVTGKRDDGYHTIDMIMQNVSLCDYVAIKPYKCITVKTFNKEISEQDNIAYKAAALFFKETGISGGAKIKIKKKIPLAAGLGGGSADAAAVLLGLDKLYETKLSVEQLEKMALTLGADVPFFIEGGTKRAEGIGERLTRLKPLRKGYFLLVKAEKKPSTAEMYKKLDGENHRKPRVDAAVTALENEDIKLLAGLMDNSFTAVWNNSKTKEMLKGLEANCVSLSGSGPTWFAYFTDKKKAKRALKAVKRQKIECYLTTPQEKAIIFE
ncbi:MAG: 4-(cytidine 5'-diphospho)-2-C-methyl-D-erythritol kinase [Clostridia bacterium]|nr:4-(cytidine 5'-diphospho)-2-C-methyl-D-erythritol kinase [Clostridia bacterium]